MPQPSIEVDEVRVAVGRYLTLNSEDPYSSCLAVVATALEHALSEDLNGSMSQSEYDTLALLAFTVLDRDPAVRIAIQDQA